MEMGLWAGQRPPPPSRPWGDPVTPEPPEPGAACPGARPPPAGLPGGGRGSPDTQPCGGGDGGVGGRRHLRLRPQVNMAVGILVFNKLVSKDGITDKKLKERAG